MRVNTNIIDSESKWLNLQELVNESNKKKV